MSIAVRILRGLKELKMKKMARKCGQFDAFQRFDSSWRDSFVEEQPCVLCFHALCSPRLLYAVISISFEQPLIFAPASVWGTIIYI